MRTNLFLLVLIFVMQSCFSQEKKGFDLSNTSIPKNEIKDGGPPKDGIPSIDAPKILKASETLLDQNELPF
ncbi:MAG: hypothetical protein MUP24_14130 [Gillisia sp.]|nr:hypothetical protein [Gillisia sp.]